MKTHPRANQQTLKRHLRVVAAQRAVGTLRQPLPPGLIPMATPKLGTKLWDNAPSLELPAYLCTCTTRPLVCNPKG